MFSSRIYACFSFGCKLLRTFGICGLNFDRRRGCFYYYYFQSSPGFEQARAKAKYYGFGVAWAALIFLHILNLYSQRAFNRMNLALAYWFPGMVAVMVYSIICLFPEEVGRSFNGMLIFGRYFHQKYMPTFQPNQHGKLAEGCATLLAFGLFLSFLGTSLFCVYDPRGDMWLGALVPPGWYSFPGVPLLIILYHSYALLLAHIGILAMGGPIIIFALYLTPLLIFELRLGRPSSSYKTEEMLRREPESLRRTYRSFQLLQANGFDLLGIIIVMANGILTLTTLYSAFVLIRYGDGIQPVTKFQMVVQASLCVGFWGGILELGRLLFGQCSRVIGSWRRNRNGWGSARENKIMSRFCASCRPIRICYGSQFVIRRTSLMVFSRVVVRGTVRALVITKPYHA